MDKALEKLSLNDAVQYLAVDVECAATGKGHNDRAPCSIAAVDKRGRTVFFRTVKVDEEVLFSPMTKITGLTREEIAEGVSARVKNESRDCAGGVLGPVLGPRRRAATSG